MWPLGLLTLTQHKGACWRICSRRHLKTVWQKEKLLVMKNYPMFQCFQLYSVYIYMYSFIYINFPYFWLDFPSWTSSDLMFLGKDLKNGISHLRKCQWFLKQGKLKRNTYKYPLTESLWRQCMIAKSAFNPFLHTTILQQTTLNIFFQNIENIVSKGKLLVSSNFFFCHNVIKKPSAAEASESVYMRERFKRSCTLEIKALAYNFIGRDYLSSSILWHLTPLLWRWDNEESLQICSKCVFSRLNINKV